MTTARLLSEGPLVEIDREGRRILARELVVDLGCEMPVLVVWNPAVAQVSDTGSTVLRVLPGFAYDGASLPWWSYRLMGPKELYEVAAVLHDALYAWQAERAAADLVFWIVARSGSQRVGPVRGWLGWSALRLGGWLPYRRRAA